MRSPRALSAVLFLLQLQHVACTSSERLRKSTTLTAPTHKRDGNEEVAGLRAEKEQPTALKAPKLQADANEEVARLRAEKEQLDATLQQNQKLLKEATAARSTWYSRAVAAEAKLAKSDSTKSKQGGASPDTSKLLLQIGTLEKEKAGLTQQRDKLYKDLMKTKANQLSACIVPSGDAAAPKASPLPVAASGASSAVLKKVRQAARVIVINLPEQKEAWKNISAELKAVGAPHERFLAACDGNRHLLPKEEIDLFRNASYLSQPLYLHTGGVHFAKGRCVGRNCGSVGCSLSHLRVYAAHVHDPFVIVAEDDALFQPKAWETTLQTIAGVAESSKDKWSTIFFGSDKYDRNTQHRGLWKYTEGLWEGRDFPNDQNRVGTTFYAISQRGMSRFLANTKRDGFWRNADYSLLDMCDGDCWVETGGVLKQARAHKSLVEPTGGRHSGAVDSWSRAAMAFEDNAAMVWAELVNP